MFFHNPRAMQSNYAFSEMVEKKETKREAGLEDMGRGRRLISLKFFGFTGELFLLTFFLIESSRGVIQRNASVSWAVLAVVFNENKYLIPTRKSKEEVCWWCGSEL